MKQYRRIRSMNLDFERIEQQLQPGNTSYPGLFRLLWEQYAEKMGKPRWGDKSLNTERYADTIFRVYPNAKILHIVRDPRDRYASALKRWKIIRGGVGSGTATWLLSVWLGARNLRKFPDRYRIIRYETLARQPEETMREICAFIGEEYLPEVLLMNGAESFREEGGNSSFEQHEPGAISARSIGRYRKYLSPQATLFIQQFARREMLAHNYQPDSIELQMEESFRYGLVDVPVNLASLIAWTSREAWFDQLGRAIPAYRIVEDIGKPSPGPAEQ
jgi:hypothetical protein